MGALKLSVIDQKNKNSRNKMRIVSKAGKPYHISACSCPCQCFVKNGEIKMDMGETASWNID